MDLENDFAALTCAQNRPPEQFEALTETCEQVLWVFKLNLTTSPIFLNQIEVECSRDKEVIDNCKNRFPAKENAGHFMSCLITEKLDEGLKPSCRDFLTQIEAVIFRYVINYVIITLTNFLYKEKKIVQPSLSVNCEHEFYRVSHKSLNDFMRLF